MKTISPEKYIEGVNSIYVEQPTYRTGGDGSDGTCDCIGMCRGALKREGVTDVKNMGGTNQAARKTIKDLKPIAGTPDLALGDVVLKTRDADDKNMPLPDRYRKGGAEYDAKWGETNFTHIGTVTGIYPLEITHMTSPTAKKDKSLGTWKYAGRLPWVKQDGGGSDPDPAEEWAKVWAESGSTVKMRAKHSASCRLYWNVPVGSEVIVREKGEPWSAIRWAGQDGYMMTKFLVFGDTEEQRYTVTICGLTAKQAAEITHQYGGLITAE